MKTTYQSNRPSLFWPLLVLCAVVFNPFHSNAQFPLEEPQSKVSSADLLASSKPESAKEKTTELNATMPVFDVTKTYANIGAYLSESLEFPEVEIERGRTGMMKVQFQVLKNGQINKIQFLESPGLEFEEAVVQVLKGAPLWTPAYRNGLAVQSTYQLHINFALQ